MPPEIWGLFCWRYDIITPMAITAKNELFCQYYASDREFFGNGVQSYIEAYEIDTSKKGAYNAAKASAFNLLTKTDILKRIDEIFEAHGLNDTFVDKQLEKLIVQDADFSAKNKAISEYNKLKGRITDKAEVATTITGSLSEVSDEELKNRIEAYLDGQKK